MQKAAVGSVQHAEAILARLHIEKRESLSVSHHHVTKSSGTHGRSGIARHGVIELAVLFEQPIVDHQRDFEGPLGRSSASSKSSRMRKHPNMPA